MTTTTDLGRHLDAALLDHPARIIACSGGVDSMLLATLAHRAAPDTTVVAHAVTPAVPPAATARVVAAAEQEGWQLELVRSAEFDDERYLSNPYDRCYFCKSNLYAELELLADRLTATDGWVLAAGTNTDDLGEHRPGLTAAAEHAVVHPYLDAGLAKTDVRALARHHELAWADLPASPCLASRLYSGTRVTATRLRAVDAGEELVRTSTGIDVVRCRVDGDEVRVEVRPEDRDRIDDALLARVSATMQAHAPSLHDAVLDDEAYAPGRAFLPVA